MINIILKIFAGLNILAGLYFAITGFLGGRSLVTVIVFLVWAAGFIGLGAVILLRLAMARLWTWILYSLLGVGTIVSLVGEFTNSHSGIFKYPLAYGVVYLVWLALSIGPIVWMTRPDVKDYFSAVPQPDEDQPLKLRKEETPS